MTLDVTLEEAQDIVKVLAQLPTSSGAFPLFEKLRQQVEAEMKEQENVG